MGWLQTKCPVDDQQKAWIEASSRWLMNELRFRFTQWQGGFKQGWSARQLGYLSEAMFGIPSRCLRGSGKKLGHPNGRSFLKATPGITSKRR
jgi:hypothetical protein